MRGFSDFLAAIAVPAQRARTSAVRAWGAGHYQQLPPNIAWNQPMFTDHGTVLLTMPWDRPVDFSLLGAMIEFNLQDKQDCTSFWRSPPQGSDV